MRSKIKSIKQCVVSHDSLKSLIAFLFLSAQLVFGESAQHDETDLPITPIQVGTPERIEVSPSEFTISPLQLVVTGHYANGEIADLTRAATLKFSSKGIAEAGERPVPLNPWLMVKPMLPFQWAIAPHRCLSM